MGTSFTQEPLMALLERQRTSDPVWCLYDLLTSYGLGNHIDAADLDIYSFYAASQYCRIC